MPIHQKVNGSMKGLVQKIYKQFLIGKILINDIKTEVYVIQDDYDSVLDYRDTLEAVKYAKENHLPWTFFTEVNVDHVPLTEEQRENRFMLINYLI